MHGGVLAATNGRQSPMGLRPRTVCGDVALVPRNGDRKMNEQNAAETFTPTTEQLLALLAMRMGELIESNAELVEAIEALTAAIEE